MLAALLKTSLCAANYACVRRTSWSARGLLIAVASVCVAGSSRAAEPAARPALDSIFDAFRTHPLVGLGDAHGLAEEGEFYKELVRDPRFAAHVRNVVFETASAGHQDTLDRYLNGAPVPDADVRKIWSDAVGVPPASLTVMYSGFLAEVRAVNATLPPHKRIRVWAGEPAVDWSTIQQPSDLDPYLDDRDVHAAKLVEREILAKGGKALVIYGHLHFTPTPLPGPPGLPSNPGLKLRIEAKWPGAFYVIVPITAPLPPPCAATEAQWPRQSLVAPVKDTPLHDCLLPRGEPARQVVQAAPGAPAIPPGQLAVMQMAFRRAASGADADALLYLAPPASLTRSPNVPELGGDGDFAREMQRRHKLQAPPGLEFARALTFEPRPYLDPSVPSSSPPRREPGPASPQGAPLDRP